MTYTVTTTINGRVINERSFITFDLVLRELIENALPHNISLSEAVELLHQVSAEEGGVIDLPGGEVITVALVAP